MTNIAQDSGAYFNLEFEFTLTTGVPPVASLLKSIVLRLIAGLAMVLALVLAGSVAASPGRGGGDDDDRDASSGDSDGPDDSLGGEGGDDDASDSGGEGGEGGDDDDAGDSGGEGGESGSGGEADDGGEGGEGSSSDDSGHSGGEGGEGSNAGRGLSSGSNSARHFDDEDAVSVTRNDAGERVRTGEAIVLTSRPDFATKLAANGFRLVESFRVEAIGASTMRVAVPQGMSARDAFDALQKLDPKGIVTFNHVYNPAGAAGQVAQMRPASPRKAVRAKVGLVDAGVNAEHPMLKQVVVNARSFDPVAKVHGDAHGTAVASLIAEAAPGATVFAANVFTLSTDGREIATADAIVRGLDWLANMRVAVINLSLTGPANPVLEAMIKRLNATGHVLVAAVGNEGPRGAPQFPAAYDKVVGVTAVDKSNRVYLYANQGDYVDFAAHGVNLRVADPHGLIDTVSGTSYAAPVVAARLATSLDAPDPARAAEAVKALKAEARDLGAPGRDPVYGDGLIGD
jgi:hypothetical protein